MFAPRILPFSSALSFGLLMTSAPIQAQECKDCPSWVFQRSTYSHSPETGARLGQYARHEFVPELPDPRLVTSGYRTTRTDVPGINGSLDSYYQVQSWANGRGGLDAEWERFHDAWQESFLTGSYFNTPGNSFGPGFGYGRYPRRGYGYRRGYDDNERYYDRQPRRRYP